MPHKTICRNTPYLSAVIPSISIVMPVRNAEKYLPACLQSIIAQAEKHWELLAVDDGSTDSSLSILQEYATSEPRIKVISQKALGIIPALRAAFAASQGQWITRMDADDLMHKDKLNQLLRVAREKGPGHLMISHVEYFRADGLGEGYRKYAEWLNELGSGATRWAGIYKECVIPSPGWLLHRNDLHRADAFQPATYPEDYDLSFRFFQAGLLPVQVNGALHYWRDHPERSSRNDPNYSDNRFLDLKVTYFLKLSLDPNRQLILWGAGKKGKSIAKKLIAAEVPFQWITNNLEKVGKHIYDIELLNEYSANSDFSNRQFIIAIAGKTDQEAIKDLLDNKKRVPGQDYFFFA